MNRARRHRWWPVIHAHARTCGKALGVWEGLRTIKSIAEKSPIYQSFSERRKRLVKYVDILGTWRGLRTLSAAAFGRNDVTVTVPGIRCPLNIRPRTSDKPVFEQIFLNRDYDLPLYISPRLIIDAGANVGFASIYFANRYPGATIIALEPARENFGVLVRNTSDYPQVIPIQAALWSTCAMLSVNDHNESWACTVEPQKDAQTEGVPGVSVTALLMRYDYSVIDILKMDIEGAEREVLAGDCRSWLTKTRVLIVELHDRFWPGCSEALESAVTGLGFFRIERGENTVLIDEASTDQ